MPPPPPPPPPGPGLPGIPPPPNLAGSAKALPNRQGLLSDITKGKQLKKAVTNDRSAPSVSGGVVGEVSQATSIGKPPQIRTHAQSSADESSGPPQLGGLFAGGMPTLRKTKNEGGSTLVPDRAAPPSVPVSLAPPPVPAAQLPSRGPPQAPLLRPNSTKSAALSSLGSPAIPPPPPPPISGATPARAAVQHAVPAGQPGILFGETTTRPSKTIDSAAGESADSEIFSHSAPVIPNKLPPSLPSAPPPPLPITNDKSTVDTVFSDSTSNTEHTIIAPSVPSPSTARVQQGTADSSLNGLQAALATRNNISLPVQNDASFYTSELPSKTATYSLKSQHIKRVDDSKYRFPPNSGLPAIRPYTNCPKLYRSGRTAGSTVPLSLSSL